jgi:hypothetical protein
MRAEKLSFSHKDALFTRLKSVKVPISEYSFANLYLFRQAHDYEVLFDDEVFIRGKTYDGFTYVMPTRDIRSIDRGHLKERMREVSFLFPVSEEWLGTFDPAEFEHSYKDGDDDYVYTVEKMATYKGRHLHKKRNLLAQFTSLYQHEARPLTADRMDDARNVLDEWQADSGVPPEKTDYYPCLESLKLYDELILCGGIYYAQNEPAGFMLGEELNEEMFVIHFAKAKKKFKGIYQYMYNNFANLLPAKYKYLNFEQDLDELPLRIAKSSYIPDLMLKKYRVHLR